MKKNVLLVIPNQKWYRKECYWHLHPYALAILASMLNRDKYNIRIVDANIDNLTPKEFEETLREWVPDVMGVSILANEFGVTGHVAAECAKNVSGDIVTVLGGVYPTTRPKDAIDDENVDYIVVGEGEDIFPRLLEYIWEGGALPESGIAFKADDKITVQHRAPFIAPLDQLPYPAFDLIDYHRYATESFKHVVDSPRALPYGKMITSRGCPIGCTFCQVEEISGKITRFQSASRVVNEMVWLRDEFGIKAIEFLDDNFLGHKGRCREIFSEMIRRDVGLVWNAMNVSSFYLTEELLELMKGSGCQYVSIAVESGVERVLKDIIKKPVNLDHVKRLISKCRELGMDSTTLWVIGSPGETWNEIRETIEVAEWMDADYTKINVATPYPGTELFDMAVDGGYMSSDFDFDDLAWGQATLTTEEFSAIELTALRAFEWDRINFTKPEKRQKIARMMNITDTELDDIRRATRTSCIANILDTRRVEMGSDEDFGNSDNSTMVAPQNVGDISIAVNS